MADDEKKVERAMAEQRREFDANPLAALLKTLADAQQKSNDRHETLLALIGVVE